MNKGKPVRLADAQRRMVEENIGLVGYTINRFGAQGLGKNGDTFQVGMIGLIKAAARYDASRAKFVTYAVKCILNELRQERRSQCRPSRGGGVPAISLDACDESDQSNLLDCIGNGEPSVEDRVVEKDMMDRAMRILDRNSSMWVRVARDYFLSDMTQGEIAERYGVSQTTVSRHVKRATRMLTRALSRQGEVTP